MIVGPSYPLDGPKSFVERSVVARWLPAVVIGTKRVRQLLLTN
jgi:hypothetical protein